MRRFDVLKADGAAYRRLMRQLPATPAEFAAMLCRVRRSLALMLETAGISASGVKGALRLKGLFAIYVAGLRAFANDESDSPSEPGLLEAPEPDEAPDPEGEGSSPDTGGSGPQKRKRKRRD